MSASPSLSSSTRYTGVAITLHWLAAIGILTALAMGIYMVDLQLSPSKIKLFNWHKWLGMTLLALAALRLLWRLFNPPPPMPATMPAWQRGVAHGVHWALYALFFAIPLVGWAYSSAAGFPIVWFGVLPLPDWVPKDPALAELLKPVHKWLAYALAALILAHILAVFKHMLMDDDDLLLRMIPGRSR